MVAIRGLALAAVLGFCVPAYAATPFFTNFLKPHFLLPITTIDGAQYAGDLTAQYRQVFFPVAPNLEVLIVGEFPRARYFSLTLYDDHGAIIDVLHDHELEPLVAGQQNPYRPGGPAGQEDILYAVTVRLGPNLATQPLTQCGFDGTDVHRNLMDARVHHTAGSFYSCQQSGFSAVVTGGNVTHDDNPGNNVGGTIMIRTYMNEGPGPGSTFDMTTPVVWLRQSSTGCSFPLTTAGQFLTPAQWYQSQHVTKLQQRSAHSQHERDLGLTVPYGLDPLNGVTWFGSDEYLFLSLPDRYLTTVIPFNAGQYPHAPAELNAQGRVLKLALRRPVVPCNGDPLCSLSGTEQLRYWGLTLLDAANHAVATIADADLQADANGYVTLIVSFDTALPAHVTPANGYTVLQLPVASAVSRLTLRNILPGAGFDCSTNNVPHRTAEHHTNGGYMGAYAPFVAYSVAANLPQQAAPFPQAGSCAPPVPPPDPCP